jgi:tetrahydromethanopterin S-methyltransferase subunit F
MSNPVSFVNAYANNIAALIKVLEDLRVQNDMITQDATLISGYFAAGPMGVRTDIAAADITNAQNAMVQMLFTFDSGSPPQKAALYKMTP